MSQSMIENHRQLLFTLQPGRRPTRKRTSAMRSVLSWFFDVRTDVQAGRELTAAAQTVHMPKTCDNVYVQTALVLCALKMYRVACSFEEFVLLKPSNLSGPGLGVFFHV